MKPKILDSEAVFRDLTRANKKLRHQHKNPDAVRRRFTEFVTLSQKLTAVMYKEYPELTSKKWEARAFPGWNPVTELFRALRNTDQHEHLIRIIIVQSQVYYGKEITVNESGTKEENDVHLVSQLVYNPDAGFKKKLPGPFAVEYFDKRHNQKEMLDIQERYFEFHLEGRTPEIERAIEAAGAKDVHKLAAQCYETLSTYYNYYKDQLVANTKNYVGRILLYESISHRCPEYGHEVEAT